MKLIRTIDLTTITDKLHMELVFMGIAAFVKEKDSVEIWEDRGILIKIFRDGHLKEICKIPEY